VTWGRSTSGGRRSTSGRGLLVAHNAECWSIEPSRVDGIVDGPGPLYSLFNPSSSSTQMRRQSQDEQKSPLNLPRPLVQSSFGSCLTEFAFVSEEIDE
jgi:hypothetical protein